MALVTLLTVSLLGAVSASNAVGGSAPTATTGCGQVSGPLATGYFALEQASNGLSREFSSLIQYPYFRYYHADLYRDCPHWKEKLPCKGDQCGLSTIPVIPPWKPVKSSKVRSEDEWYYTDDHTDGEFFDLVENPERYTGYSGRSAARQWSAIHEGTGFGLKEYTDAAGAGYTLSSLPDDRGNDLTGECAEKRVYHKILSGLHASISTNLCHNNLRDVNSGAFTPNLQCFTNRVAVRPQRAKDMYFNAELVLSALARIGPQVAAANFSASQYSDDSNIREKAALIVHAASQIGNFDSSALFKGADGAALKKEFKNHFRKATRIMDCVACATCRLWGKVQFQGIATALKIIFDLDETTLRENPHLLDRSELVSLFHTAHRLIESLRAVRTFRGQWAALDKVTSLALVHEAKQRLPELTSAKEADEEHSSFMEHLAGTLLQAVGGASVHDEL